MLYVTCANLVHTFEACHQDHMAEQNSAAATLWNPPGKNYVKLSLSSFSFSFSSSLFACYAISMTGVECELVVLLCSECCNGV